MSDEMVEMPERSDGSARFAQAERLFRAGDLEGALPLFEELAGIDSWFYDALPFLIDICASLRAAGRLELPDAERLQVLEEWLDLRRSEMEYKSVVEDPQVPQEGGHEHGVAASRRDHDLDSEDESWSAREPLDEPQAAESAHHARSHEEDIEEARDDEGTETRRNEEEWFRERVDGEPPADGAVRPGRRRRSGSGSTGSRVSKSPRRPAKELLSDEIEATEKDESIERTPHLDISTGGPVRAGDRFEASIYLDTHAARPGESAVNVVARSGSEVEVSIIVSSHFRLIGSNAAKFVLSKSESRTDLKPFKIECLPSAEWDEGRPAIIAVFFVDGRPCGKVSRAVDVEGIEMGPIVTADPKIEVGANGSAPADLTVTIVADPENDGRRYWCTVSTPHLPVSSGRTTGPWNLRTVTQTLVSGFMDRFTAADTRKAQLISELSGAGKLLFEASPAIFQKVFWEMMDAGHPPRSIAIVSEEPFIPWELMIPSRRIDGRLEEREDPLGVEFDIGRWTDERVIAPPRNIVLHDSHVIAPVYEGEMALNQAADEARMVMDRYRGDLVSPADFEKLQAALGGVGRSLVHFVCHGKDDAGGIQAIHLEAGDELTSANILGMKGVAKTFAAKRPVVFLNACEVGRGAPALVGLGGFVSSFIRLGASAVIAPLWSVEDEVAHAIAQEFYRTVELEPETPFSAIFSKIRAKAYDPAIGKDTYAAYCFYGDPYAAAAR